MQQILFVGLGGFIGASLRYIISLYATKHMSNYLPFGTLIVNILGGFLIGFILDASIKHTFISPNLKLLLTTGIMGGLTTFSTFSYETITIFTKGNYILGMLNIFLNIFLSLLGVYLGKALV